MPPKKSKKSIKKIIIPLGTIYKPTLTIGSALINKELENNILDVVQSRDICNIIFSYLDPEDFKESTPVEYNEISNIFNIEEDFKLWSPHEDEDTYY